MTFAFALCTVGWILLRSGWTHRSLSDTLRSSPPPEDTLAAAAPVDTPISDSLSALLDEPTNLVRGVVPFDGKRVAAWIVPILMYGRKHGWRGHVVSGFRTRAEQQRIWDSGVRPAAMPGTSNHEGSIFPRGAVDVTDARELHEILIRSRYRKVLIWAGSKDPPHFSHPHGGSY